MDRLKKIYVIFFVSILLLGIGFIISSSFKIEETNLEPEQLVEEYDSVVNMIRDGTISVQPNGCVILPDEFKYLSDSGECFVVRFLQDKTALYFYSFRGILDSSKGYIYTTDKISYSDYINTDVYVIMEDFTNIVELTENLFSCSTD